MKMFLFSLVSLTFLLTSGCTKKLSQQEADLIEDNTNVEKITASKLEVDSKGLSKKYATLKTVHGNIKFKFYPKQAPVTVTRIIQLIRDGYYDGITFHRVVKNFVIQAGDPTGTGSGGSGKKIKAEFSQLHHIKGTVAMARVGGDNDSADSQFYIALTSTPQLDGKYTIFGQVFEGLDLLDKVRQGDRILSLSFD